MPDRERLLKIFFTILLLSLPFSKGVATVASLVLVLFSVGGINFQEFKKNLKQYPHIGALALIFVAYCVGMFYTEHLREGFQFLKGTHRYLIFPAIILTNVRHFRFYVNYYLLIFLIGLTVAGILTISLLLLPEPTVIKITENFPLLTDYPNNSDRLRYGLYSPFIDRIQFSNLLGIGMISSLYLLVKTKKYLRYLLFSLFLFGTSLLLGGRGGQLGLLGGTSVFLLGISTLFLYPRLVQKAGKGVAVAVLTGLAFLIVVVVPLSIYFAVPAVQKRYNQMLIELNNYANDPDHSENYEHQTTVRRIVSWQNHWAVVKEHPVLGVGTGDYLPEVQKVYDRDSYNLPLNSHSQYLHIWATLGLWGMVLFLGILGLWLKKLAQPSADYIFGLSFMSLYAISFIPDAVLLTQIDSMAFSIFFCLIGLKARTAGREEISTQPAV